VELLAALLAALAFQTEGVSIRFFITLYFLLCLVAIFFIDLEHLIIADVLVIPTILLGVILAVVDPVPYLMGHGLWAYLVESGLSPRLVGLIGSVAGFVLGFGILWLISALYKAWRGRAGLGDGDPPLLGLIGIYLGWLAIFPVLFLSTAMGLLTVGFLVVTGRMSREKIANQPIPFGPFLSLAAIIWYFFGQSILTWYLNLFT
jgi:leader peptidase (prepilin peptidase)/N-methyltransferase